MCASTGLLALRSNSDEKMATGLPEVVTNDRKVGPNASEAVPNSIEVVPCFIGPLKKTNNITMLCHDVTTSRPPAVI